MNWQHRSELTSLVCSDASLTDAEIVFIWNRRHPEHPTDTDYVAGIRLQCNLVQTETDPTPEELAERARQVREDGFDARNGRITVHHDPWSKREAWTRQAIKPIPWIVPGAESVQRDDDAVREMLGEEKREDTE